MLDGQKGMVKHHARATVGHDGSNAGAHFGLKAMDSAGIASSLVFMRASACAHERVLHYFEALVAEPILPLGVVMATAIDSCHGHHGLLVFFQPALGSLAKFAVLRHCFVSRKCA